VNATAGRGRAGRDWPAVERALRSFLVPFDAYHTQDAREALAVIRQLPPDCTVATVGGDGTVKAILPAMVGTNRALGVIPLGSGNDFAGLRGLSPGDVPGAVKRLLGPPERFDTLWYSTPESPTTEVPLLNGLGMGFDAQVAALVPAAPARLNGFGRYAWAAMRALRRLRNQHVQVRVDGSVTYEGPSCLVAVMNGVRYGGGFRIAPDADPRDGSLDVVLGTDLTRVQLLRLMTAVLRGAHQDDPRVRCWRGRSVQLTWASPTHAHVDGDVIGELSTLSVGVRPGSVLLH